MNSITFLTAFLAVEFFAAAVVIGQFVDSMIFYPIVFHAMPLHDLVVITTSGYVTKIVCGLFLAPAYLYAVHEGAEP